MLPQFALTLLGLWVLSVMSRPLTARVVVLILAMYATLAAVVLVPASRWYHRMEVPPTDVLVAALVHVNRQVASAAVEVH